MSLLSRDTRAGIAPGRPVSWKLRDDASGWTPKLQSGPFLGSTGGDSVYYCYAATTANITLSGAQTVDGASPTSGDKILVWKQSTAAQNGVYTYSSSGAWTRVKTFDLADPLLAWVQNGATYGECVFGVTAANTVKGTGALYK